ncbi:MAG: hypothetical protein CVV27_07820 [Candidatus Melainabacteria bacterium HGW-Melainabacteria-1]|nr:MAG: hypothetical protein CVV27_07820 [Candidatus Melainabacteria bacterium HGW-Melainabacteria-1]
MEAQKENKVKANLIKTAVVLGLLALVGSPWLIWQLQPTQNLKLLIVDKTVPVPSYREHASLIWALNHLKVQAPQQRDSWALATDYIGYYPPANGGPGGVERKLKAQDLVGQDLLFITDTYGVYQQDVAEAGHKQAPDYSARLIGGIDATEVDAIEAFVGRGGALIGEFNTFATPTAKAARTRMENLFGVRWQGWAGRYFADLDHPTEVPAWAHRKWKAQSGQDWSFSGPGWILDHEENKKLLVLRRDHEIGKNGLLIHKTQDHPLTKGMDTGIPFYFWFDVVTPQPGAQVLAEYEMDLTPAGQKLWSAAGLPARFPALTVVEKPSLRLYMSGDASDTDLILGPVAIAGRQQIESIGKTKHQQSDQGAFFWELYLPVLRNALAQIQSDPVSAPPAAKATK